jgi:hypothetical protein
MKEQSAVEWLLQKLEDDFSFYVSSDIVEKAKQIEKEQKNTISKEEI